MNNFSQSKEKRNKNTKTIEWIKNTEELANQDQNGFGCLLIILFTVKCTKINKC